ncbi:MAG: thioester domain-containing protein [Candidatus Dormibacteria bacterium]
MGDGILDSAIVDMGNVGIRLSCQAGANSVGLATAMRRRYRWARQAGVRRRRRTAVAAIAAVFPVLLLGTALAAPGHALRLQGAGIAGEFVAQPYWPVGGTVGGHHVVFEAGLLGFAGDQGPAGTGYCIDLRTHRVHTATYTAGADLEASGAGASPEILWLLQNAYPSGPALLGLDARGRARSSSAVQAAIWHFSDGFQLDRAGAPFVDPALRSAYDSLVAAAVAPHPHAIEDLELSAPHRLDIAASSPAVSVPVTGNLVLGSGESVQAGGVSLWSDSGALAADGGQPARHDQAHPLRVPVRNGRFSVRLVVPAASRHTTVAADAIVEGARARVLVATEPSQRLVTSVPLERRLTVGVTVEVVVHRPPVPVAARPPRPAPTVKPAQGCGACARPPVAVPTPVQQPPVELPPVARPPMVAAPPGLPTTGHDLRPGVGLSLGLTLAGLALLGRSRPRRRRGKSG